MRKSQRKFIVFSTLLGVLTLTSALLMALAPAPLVPDAATSLFAVDEPRSMDAVFQTRVPIADGRWNYIYIHHSRTDSGNAMSLGEATNGLGDHFVIGNGDGLLDGEIQLGQRWNNQNPARPPVGGSPVPGAISICLVGDFDRMVPTPTQIRRVTQLVDALQHRLQIDGANVLLEDRSPTPAGIGRYFPRTAFRKQLLP